jgi:glycolate oxidase FAD binding subunit
LNSLSEEITSIAPGSVSELAEILRNHSGSHTPVVPIGGGTKQHLGCPPQPGSTQISLARFNAVHHYDAGDLTLSVGAGITLAELQAILAERRQFLPVDPMLPQQATIGGVLATNALGPMRSGFGGVRDFCIGIEFVTADGEIAHGGGKVVKNVAGYDLMKLLIGSHGTLAVITSASFKVFPRPQRTHTFVSRFAGAEDALAYRRKLRAALGGGFMAMEIVSPRAHEYLEEHIARDPDDYAPAAPVKPIEHWSLALRVSGSDAVIARYRRELQCESMEELPEDAMFWQRLSDFEVAVHRRHRNAMVLYVSSPISAMRAVLEAAAEVAPEHTMLTATVGRAATGNLVVCFMPLAVDPPSAMAFANAASAFRGRLSPDISVAVARCPEESKDRFDIWGETPTDLSMMRAVKHALDPHNILNRGRFIVG